jgi:hypothetical protein
MAAPNAPGQRQMMSPPQVTQPGAHAATGYANPGAPAMNQAGILTQTGFHNAALGAPPAQQQQQSNLHLSGRAMAPHGANAHAPQRTAARPEAQAQRPRTTPRPTNSAGGKTLEGTRFRPRNQSAPRQQPRATPIGMGKTKSFTWVLVGLGVTVLGIVAWVASSFF